MTETVTEYKEATDDADFSGFGSGIDVSTSSVKSSRPSSSFAGLQYEPSKSSGNDDKDKFIKDALDAHNEYRAKHGVSPLTLSKRLCESAQAWADKLARENRFEHDTNCDYGENLYCSWSSNPKAVQVSGRTPVDSWYSESKKHMFGCEPHSTATGHFTQVVWKASKEFGIGKAVAPRSGKVIVVGNYDPPGNFVGKYTENVLPPKF